MKRSLAILALIIAAAVPTVLDTPCAYEDSPMCTWDGSTQGNKAGATVYNLFGPYYITLGA